MKAETALQQYQQLAIIDHEQLAHEIIEKVKEGEVNPLDVQLSMKRVEKIQKLVTEDKELKEIVLDESKKHLTKGKSFDYKNAKLTVGATYTWYDFSETGDIYYERLLELQKTLKEAVKERETYLKTLIPKDNALKISKPTIIVTQLPTLEMLDCEEEIVITPPLKKQKEGVKVQFKKNWELRKEQENS